MARSLAGSARPSTDRLFFDTLADLFDPPKVDVFALLGYEPTPRQAEFHQATEWDLLYGGAAGGGKTRALLMEGLRACITYPGIAVLAIRESYPQLAESFIAELARVTYAQALGATYNKTDHNLNFTNGSQIRFRYCDGLEDAKLRLGSEIQLLLVDEATMQAPEAIDFLGMRLRSSNPAIPVLGIRHGSNPGGIGHAWAKQRYVDGTDHGQKVYEDVVDDKPTGHMVRFIPARYTDNPHVPDYESVLDAIKDPALRVAYRDGSWDTFAGQFFTEWNRDRHVVPAFAIPEDWTRITGMDWGYAAPHAVLWGAINDRRVWIYRELYGTQVGERDLARQVLRGEGALTEAGDLSRERTEHVRVRVGDPSMWNKVAEATPIAGTFAAEGVPMVKAANDRIAGWQRVHTYLADGPACDIHREMGWDTCPLLHVLDGAAPNLVRTLPALPHDPKKAEDVDCFVAGTMIRTPAGERPVESIRVGDLIDTPMGPQRVIKAEPEVAVPVARVDLSNGATLVGTADHEVVTSTRGLVSLQTLRTTDRLVAWTPATRSSTGATRIAASLGAATTSPPPTPSPSTTVSRSTGTSIATWLATSPLAFMFTTRTATPRTTTPRTSPSFRRPSTRGSTTRIAGPTSLHLVEPGNRLTTPSESSDEPSQRPVPTQQRIRARALIVAALTDPATLAPSSAQSSVSALGDGRSTFGTARSAVSLSVASATEPTSLRPAPTRVDGSYGVETVYALTVDGCGLYYANGLLVTNTDAEDHCLVAGTEVLTSKGPLPIESVTPGQSVLTRKGWRQVTAAGMTGRSKPVTTVVMSNGHAFTATGSHPVWTQNRGWVSVDALRYADTLLTWQESTASPSTASCSVATPTVPTEAKPSTTSRLATSASAASDASTRKSGSQRTATFQRATTSTTRTATRSTTTRPTSSLSPKPSTSACTATSTDPTLSTWPESKNSPRPGIAHRKAERGTANTGGRLGSIALRLLTSAISAAQTSPRSLVMAASGSAPTTARAPGAEPAVSTTNSACALGAASRSQSAATPPPSAAPVYVRGSYAAGRADVYNLTVEGEPEFFANGVLVHNCPDALRYLLMHLTAPAAKRERIPEPVTPQERIRAQLDRNRRGDRYHPVLGAQ